MTELEIRDRLAQYTFYHVIPLTENLATPGNPAALPLQAPLAAALTRLDLRGKRVLDVGCRDGLFSFQAERQGAAEVVGIDSDLSRPAVEFLIPFFNSSVRMVEFNLYEMTPDHFGKFDVVLFAGVLYHLRYPNLAFKVLREVMHRGGTLLIETAIFHGADDHAMLYCPVGNDSPYEPTSCTFYNKKGLTDTLASFGFRTLSFTCLNPAAGKKRQRDSNPIIDRAVVECEYTGHCGNEFVERYWHGEHAIYSEHGGRAAMTNGLLNWKEATEYHE
jgi:SAM-dependent methyltransferase